MDQQLSKLLTEIETAEILGVSPTTLATWRCTRRYPLPYVRVGRRAIRYRAEDVAAFVLAGVVGGEPGAAGR
jgi:predicted site-specific integrase-resolvase